MDLGLSNAAAVTGLTGRGSPDALGVTADVGDAAAIDQAFAEIGERWGGQLNALVITVGTGAAGTFEDLTDDQWRQSVEDGVLGIVRCGAVRSCGASAAAQGAMGADRQLFGALDSAAKRHAARLYGG